MRQAHVSIRDLKSRLSHYLRLTKAGELVVITERGVPIGRKLAPMAPVAKRRGKRTVARLLVDDRE